MKVLNVHKRTVNQPKSKIEELLKLWQLQIIDYGQPEKWPEMRFANGIRIGAKGGHGAIKYSVEQYNPEWIIQFHFLKPHRFNGFHKSENEQLSQNQTQIKPYD